jgi:hypothetical protein
MNIFFYLLSVWFGYAVAGIVIYKDKLGYCETPNNFNINYDQCLD